MTTFYVLWILIGAGNTQSLAVDHFVTFQECEAARDGFIVDYNSTVYFDVQKVSDKEARCFKAEVKK